MRRLCLIFALSLLPAPVRALPGDEHVRITERTPPATTRPHPGPRRSPRRRVRPRPRPAAQPAARLSPADRRQGWQLLSAIAARLRETSEAWFEARQVTRGDSAAGPMLAMREEAELLARMLVFCRARVPSSAAEQTAWRRACDELLSVARDCAHDPAPQPSATPQPIAVSHRTEGDPAAGAMGDLLQRLERMGDALARAQELVGRYLPTP
jgi:hypothetical protein